MAGVNRLYIIHSGRGFCTTSKKQLGIVVGQGPPLLQQSPELGARSVPPLHLCTLDRDAAGILSSTGTLDGSLCSTSPSLHSRNIDRESSTEIRQTGHSLQAPHSDGLKAGITGGVTGQWQHLQPPQLPRRSPKAPPHGSQQKVRVWQVVDAHLQ